MFVEFVMKTIEWLTPFVIVPLVFFIGGVFFAAIGYLQDDEGYIDMAVFAFVVAIAMSVVGLIMAFTS